MFRRPSGLGDAACVEGNGIGDRDERVAVIHNCGVIAPAASYGFGIQLQSCQGLGGLGKVRTYHPEREIVCEAGARVTGWFDPAQMEQVFST